jgi:hypothetical protein
VLRVRRAVLELPRLPFDAHAREGIECVVGLLKLAAAEFLSDSTASAGAAAVSATPAAASAAAAAAAGGGGAAGDDASVMAVDGEQARSQAAAGADADADADAAAVDAQPAPGTSQHPLLESLRRKLVALLLRDTLPDAARLRLPFASGVPCAIDDSSSSKATTASTSTTTVITPRSMSRVSFACTCVLTHDADHERCHTQLHNAGSDTVSLTQVLAQEVVDHFRATAEHPPAPVVAESAHPYVVMCVTRVRC